MMVLDTLHGHPVKRMRKADRRRRGAPRPRVEGLEERVVLVATTTALTISPPGSQVYGTTLTLTATVTDLLFEPVVRGVVTFYDGQTPLGTSSLGFAGQATLTTATLPVGADPLSASFDGYRLLPASTSPTVTETITPSSNAATTTTVTSAVASPVYGQSDAITATVADVSDATIPRGSVQFLVDGAASGPLVELSAAGTAVFAMPTLTAGSHSIGTDFLGGGGAPSSGTVGVTVGQATTTTTVTAPGAVFGQSETLTATVAAVAPGAGAPTGSVEFYDGATDLGPGTLSGGVARLTTAALPIGDDAITAQYGGATDFVASQTTTATTVVVGPDATTTALTAAPVPADYGQSETLTARVAAAAPGAGTPTGTVEFFDGMTPLGPGTLDSGVATLTTSALIFGPNPITASYGGDDDFLASTSTVTTIDAILPSTISLTASITSAISGESVALTATVAAAAPGAGTPTGQVTFYDGATAIGTETLSGGVAVLTTSALPTGSDAITASYGGDDDFAAGATTTATTIEVDQDASTTSLVASPGSAAYGQTVTLTATVAAVAPGSGTPTGAVTFTDGSIALGQATLSGGVATLVTSALPTGPDTITASYGGDDDFVAGDGSTSATVSQAATTLILTPSPSPADYGVPVTFTARVADAPSVAAPTGSVQFRIDGVDAGSPVTLAGGFATFTDTTLGSGSHAIAATYVPDDSDFSGSSGTASFDVRPAVVSIARTDAAGTVEAGPTVTYAVTFTEPVTGVSPGDFKVVTTGTAATAPTVAVSGSGASYIVTVSGIAGAGTVELELVSAGSIADANGLGLAGIGAGGFGPPQSFAVGDLPQGAVVGDLNGDGIPDLVVSEHSDSGHSLDVLIGLGGGNFEPAVAYDAGVDAGSVALADVTGNGILDIITLNWGGTISVLMGRGDGTFAPALTYNDDGAAQTGLAVADLNGDGKPDIVTANYYNQPVNVLLNNGDGTFAPAVNYSAQSGDMAVAVGDLNGDGIPDIVSTNWDAESVSVFMGIGNGSFAAPVSYGVGYAPGNVSIGDVNGDGKADIVVGNAGDGTVSVLLNDGDGTFAPQQVYGIGLAAIAPNYSLMSTQLADLSGDGLLDIVVAYNTWTNGAPDGTVVVLPNDGDGTFGAPVSYTVGVAPDDVTVADLNGDGVPDLIVTDRNTDSVDVLLGLSRGVAGDIYTVDSATAPPPVDVSGSVFLDVNGDGVREVDEPGLAGRLVFIDLSGSGSYAPGDPSAVTDADGDFLISDASVSYFAIRPTVYPADVTTKNIIVRAALTDSGAATLQVFGLRFVSGVDPLAVRPSPFGPVANPDLDTAIAQGLYNLLLGRNADRPGLEAAVSALESGMTPAQLATSFQHSSEYEARIAMSDYATFLGRPADAPGLSAAVAAMQAGMTEVQLAESFLDSAEYSGAHASGAAFVQALYQDVLGRTGSTSEVDAWLAAMGQGVGRSTVVADCVTSAESTGRSIADDYVGLLGRMASSSEVDAWVAAVESGSWTLDEVSAAFLGSPEFHARAGKSVE